MYWDNRGAKGLYDLAPRLRGGDSAAGLLTRGRIYLGRFICRPSLWCVADRELNFCEVDRVALMKYERVKADILQGDNCRPQCQIGAPELAHGAIPLFQGGNSGEAWAFSIG